MSWDKLCIAVFCAVRCLTTTHNEGATSPTEEVGNCCRALEIGLALYNELFPHELATTGVHKGKVIVSASSLTLTLAS